MALGICMGKSQNLGTLVCGGDSHTQVLYFHIVLSYPRVSTVDETRLSVDETRLYHAPRVVSCQDPSRGLGMRLHPERRGGRIRPLTKERLIWLQEVVLCQAPLYCCKPNAAWHKTIQEGDSVDLGRYGGIMRHSPQLRCDSPAARGPKLSSISFQSSKCRPMLLWF